MVYASICRDLFLVNFKTLCSHACSRKGISSSVLPYRRAPPAWLKTTPEEVVDQIIKLACKGLTPSQIGVTLRDSHGIPQVRFVTGNKILRILKSQGVLSSPYSVTLSHTLSAASSSPSSLSRLSFVYFRMPFVWG
ncbi:ribosomal 40S subunit protein S13 [Stygiomarasmius scandens]|uniref:Ribosomal 40S subunit protein S13 n=1 Tax=Marasmiellus scandens TaxID=2682957 RepID=A0ABR1J5Z6_9AGAR